LYQRPPGMRVADAEQNRLPLAESARRSGDNPAHQGNCGNTNTLRLSVHSRPAATGRLLINYKKTHRIYCLEGLNLRRKRPRRHISAAHRQQRPALTHIDQCWSMDFVSDSLFNGRRFRALTVVDNFSRKCLAIHAGKSLKGEDVVRVMEALRLLDKRLLVRIQTDNGSEFISKSLDKWAYEHGVKSDSRARKTDR
jgi:transposase InsO family protein